MPSKISVAQFNTLCDEQLPFARTMGLELVDILDDRVLMRAKYSEAFLRPGGTISGPIMMALADAAMYALVLSRIGPVELAVTTNLSINFLRKPLPGDVLAEAKMLKLGKRLAVGEVNLFSAEPSTAKSSGNDLEGIDPKVTATVSKEDRTHVENEIVAHVIATYSIPPQR